MKEPRSTKISNIVLVRISGNSMDKRKSVMEKVSDVCRKAP